MSAKVRSLIGYDLNDFSKSRFYARNLVGTDPAVAMAKEIDTPAKKTSEKKSTSGEKGGE